MTDKFMRECKNHVSVIELLKLRGHPEYKIQKIKNQYNGFLKCGLSCLKEELEFLKPMTPNIDIGLSDLYDRIEALEKGIKYAEVEFAKLQKGVQK